MTARRARESERRTMTGATTRAFGPSCGRRTSSVLKRTRTRSSASQPSASTGGLARYRPADPEELDAHAADGVARPLDGHALDHGEGARRLPHDARLAGVGAERMA